MFTSGLLKKGGTVSPETAGRVGRITKTRGRDETRINLFVTFVMSEATYKQIEALPAKRQLAFYKAVSEYGTYAIYPNFEGLEYVIWIPMRDLINSSKQHNEEWHGKLRENGKKAVGRKSPLCCQRRKDRRSCQNRMRLEARKNQ
jgi:hypothetical protein